MSRKSLPVCPGLARPPVGRRGWGGMVLALAAAGLWCNSARAQATDPADPVPAPQVAEPGASAIGVETLPVPDWFGVLRDSKTDLREATGTSVALCINAQNQIILNAEGEGKNRSVFWWNLDVSQDLWSGGQLLVKTRGGARQRLRRP